MKKTPVALGPLLIIFGLILIIVGTWYVLKGNDQTPVQVSIASDYKNISYVIEGQTVALVDGVAEFDTAPGSASKTVVRYFGNDATGDLNGDGIADTAFIVTEDTGGTGTFYYVVAALKTANGYQGTNAVLLGDRVAPQSTVIQNGKLIVNYADRTPNEPMTAAPSVGVSKYLSVNGVTLSEDPHAAGLGEHCGGNMTTAAVCAAGLHCAPTPGSHLPFGDVGGACVSD